MADTCEIFRRTKIMLAHPGASAPNPPQAIAGAGVSSEACYVGLRYAHGEGGANRRGDLTSKGSQFGHTAIEMDGTVYGRAPSTWDVDSRINYLKRQNYRDTWGYKLIVKLEEKFSILAFIQKQRAQNKGYDILINSCSFNTADALGAAGLIVHDPRFSLFTVSPKDLVVGLKHSKRLVDTATYPKK